jgi:glucose/mannose transport system substrate-binding protein
MQQGLEILASGAILPDGNQTLSPDTQSQIEDLMVEFWNDPSYSAADAQAKYAEIIADAD